MRKLNPLNKILKNHQEGPLQGLELLNKTKCKNDFREIELLDKNYEAWKNSEGVVKAINLPFFNFSNMAREWPPVPKVLST